MKVKILEEKGGGGIDLCADCIQVIYGIDLPVTREKERGKRKRERVKERGERGKTRGGEREECVCVYVCVCVCLKEIE